MQCVGCNSRAVLSGVTYAGHNSKEGALGLGLHRARLYFGFYFACVWIWIGWIVFYLKTMLIYFIVEIVLNEWLISKWKLGLNNIHDYAILDIFKIEIEKWMNKWVDSISIWYDMLKCDWCGHDQDIVFLGKKISCLGQLGYVLSKDLLNKEVSWLY